jgi:uncharacterized protein YecE (DUF72 family)
MRVRAGTSGFSYKEWKGPFYPPKIKPNEMLRYYASRLPAVEINNTFYRLPTAAQLREWRLQVPDTFRFAVKAPRRITHVKRLEGCAEDVRYLTTALEELRPLLGSILFQLPPFLRVDVPRLAGFLEHLPSGLKAAFEFRHDSWFVRDVFDLLTARDFALAQSEDDERSVAGLPWTARWGYLRLRKSVYGDADLDAWCGRIGAASLDEAQVFFKHEDKATGPLWAEAFLSRCGASGS